MSTQPPSLQSIIFNAIERSGISRVDLSKQLGLNRCAVSNWAQPGVKIPIHRAIAVAKILGLDPIYIRNIALNESYPGLFDYDERLRKYSDLTTNEGEFLEIIRASGKRNPRMNEEQKKEFAAFVAKLSDDTATARFVSRGPGRPKPEKVEATEKFE